MHALESYLWHFLVTLANISRLLILTTVLLLPVNDGQETTAMSGISTYYKHSLSARYAAAVYVRLSHHRTQWVARRSLSDEIFLLREIWVVALCHAWS
jgi:hypothetical protein